MSDSGLTRGARLRTAIVAMLGRIERPMSPRDIRDRIPRALTPVSAREVNSALLMLTERGTIHRERQGPDGTGYLYQIKPFRPRKRDAVMTGMVGRCRVTVYGDVEDARTTLTEMGAAPIEEAQA